MDRAADRSIARPSGRKKLRRLILPGPVSGTDHRRAWIARSMLVVLALGLVWRVARFAACPPMWGDEAFIAVNVLTHGFAGLLGPLDYYQIAPAGFLWVERAVYLALGASEWALRLVPFAAGLGSLVLFRRFADRAIDRRSALMAVGIFAASFYPVRHATEVKPYATDLLLSMVVTSLAWSILKDDRHRVGRWVGLTIAVGVGVWFSYPLVFVASGVGIVLGLRAWKSADRRGLAWFAGFSVASAASWLAMYVGFARPQSRSAPFYTQLETWRGAFPPWSKPWDLPGWLLDVHTGNMLAYPNGGNHFGSLATTGLVGVGIFALRRSRPALLAMLLMPLAMTFLASSINLYPYGTSARTSLYMAPAFCLLAGVGLVHLFRRLKPRLRRPAYRLATLGLAAAMVAATVTNVALPYKNFEDGENRRVVLELAAKVRAGDRWIVSDGLPTMPIYPGLMLEHWLQQEAEVRYNVLARSPVPVAWMPKDVESAAQGTGRTWFLVHRHRSGYFDENRVASDLARLKARLGEPTVEVYRMTRGESVDAYLFERR